MKPILYSFILLFGMLLCNYIAYGQQKVGLVLSGGGATGFAHIGVIQALEEKGIPIDYITGTSAGALIGALYAAGYSPQEIKDFVLNEDFLTMSTGNLKPQQQFLIKENEPTASMFEFSFSRDSVFKKSLPTNISNSTFLDFEMLKILGTVGAAHNNNFNDLFIPFRCLASDIVSKKSVVFRNGPLNEAVRASMTFPFYFEPLRINGRLLFDGGLYNNFPADVLYSEFSPDYIVGSNVSYNAEQPMEKDLISQVINMLVSYSNFDLPCENGFIIEPKLEISTFEFTAVEDAIAKGYAAGIKYSDSILPYIKNTISPDSLAVKRKLFKAQSENYKIDNIQINSPKNTDYFIRRSLLSKRADSTFSLAYLERRYYRLAATEQIDFLFPVLKLNENNFYDLNLEVQRSNEWKLDVGGHISSRPVNQGYIGLTYLGLRKTATKLHGSTYFGKFYGSAHGSVKIELPAFFPLTIQPYYTRNRWDYFKSFATFFEEVKPSFLIQNESYTGVKLFHPIGNNSVSIYDARYFKNEDDYYQSNTFGVSDTTDETHFEGFNLSWEIKQNSLNRKQFASSGSAFSLKARYVNGREMSVSGSTSPNEYAIRNLHSWFNFNFSAQTFIIDKPFFHLGLQGQATFNTQSLFANYTASILQLTTFDLVPDAQTFFLPEYRSPLFFGGGTNVIFTIRKGLDVRFDGFIYQPLVILLQGDNGTFGYSKPFKGETFMASASLVYNSFFGPIRFSTNYFPAQKKPFSLQVSFGYVIFNERSNR